MPVKYPRLTDEKKLIYMAGLFDAWGSVMIQKKGLGTRRKTVQYSLILQLTAPYEATVRWAERTFGGNVTEARNRYFRRGKPFKAWKWRTSASHAAWFLDKVRPYLKIERKRSTIAIRFQRHMDAYTRRRQESRRGAVLQIPKRVEAYRQRLADQLAATRK